MFQKNVLTRPDEAHHIICCDRHSFRGEAIFHGRISLHNVSSLSHSPDVVNVGVLVFQRQLTPGFKDDHVTSILECSAKLSCV